MGVQELTSENSNNVMLIFLYPMFLYVSVVALQKSSE